MNVLGKTSKDSLASVYLLDFGADHIVECVESIQPPIPRDEKWVLIISTSFGCPVGCRMCDAGGGYRGKLSTEEMLTQIDFLVRQRYPNGRVPAAKFKIQFARMGEPAFNPAVLDILCDLPGRFDDGGLLPSVSTVAPHGCDTFFEKLIDIKQRHYPNGRFQMQFSIHTTDPDRRDWLIPIKKWSFEQIAAYGERFFQPGDRKITLNFAWAADSSIEPTVLLRHFDPQRFCIKITPVNPTLTADAHALTTQITDAADITATAQDILRSLETAGYDVILSIGELEENQIGSNCGQYVARALQQHRPPTDSYTYELQRPATDNHATTFAQS